MNIFDFFYIAIGALAVVASIFAVGVVLWYVLHKFFATFKQR